MVSSNLFNFEIFSIYLEMTKNEHFFQKMTGFEQNYILDTDLIMILNENWEHKRYVFIVISAEIDMSK